MSLPMAVLSPPGMINPSTPSRSRGRRTACAVAPSCSTTRMCSRKSPCSARTPMRVMLHSLVPPRDVVECAALAALPRHLSPLLYHPNRVWRTGTFTADLLHEPCQVSVAHPTEPPAKILPGGSTSRWADRRRAAPLIDTCPAT